MGGRRSVSAHDFREQRWTHPRLPSRTTGVTGFITGLWRSQPVTGPAGIPVRIFDQLAGRLGTTPTILPPKQRLWAFRDGS